MRAAWVGELRSNEQINEKEKYMLQKKKKMSYPDPDHEHYFSREITKQQFVECLQARGFSKREIGVALRTGACIRRVRGVIKRYQADRKAGKVGIIPFLE